MAGALAQILEQVLSLHHVAVLHWLLVEEGQVEMVQAVDGVREEQRVGSDRVAVGRDHQVVKGRGHLCQSIHLLQAAYVGGVEGQVLQHRWGGKETMNTILSGMECRVFSGAGILVSASACNCTP